ncbi:MAG: hypothetical protein KR126chlam6_00816 [Candidatus Anoxychlamydiales bacterium]|nr:hypothetical protein [Candidatus Anoxychlamydiales bacterium]
MTSYLQYISLQNAYNLVMWPFRNEKFFFNFTVPTISYLAAQRFSNYCNDTSYYYSAGAFLTAGAASIAFQICKCLDSNLSKGTNNSPRVVRAEPKQPEFDPLVKVKREKQEAQIVEAARNHLSNLKAILETRNSVFVEEIFSPFIQDPKEIDTEKLSNDQKNLLEASPFFGISISQFNEICKKSDVYERFELFLRQFESESLDFLFSKKLFDTFLPGNYKEYLAEKTGSMSV